ncbi:hypothetical protein Fcan01_15514 [Folsomia candida]|uniref:Uncharacterized protein n=1 Tax=Folsomia candida TaxID=158441 RepID=A0A226DWX9_FOLCA|nr:hypothetical protein Fcan01_15514 [Folsomia candida]
MEMEMRPIPPHGPDQEIIRSPRPGFQRMLLYIANEQYENVRNKWIKWMSWQPSPDSGWVQVFEKLPGFKQAVKPGLHHLMRYLKRANLGSHASSDGSAWSRNDAGGLLQVIDQTCSAGTTYAGLNHVYDDYNYNFKQTLDIDGDDVFDDPTTKAMTWRIIPFLKKATYNCGDVIAGCFLNRKSIHCGSVFKKRFSEWGGTCMFNGIPGPVTRRIRTIQSVLSEGEYTTEEISLLGGTISMITGLTLLDIIEAIVVIATLIAAQHKIRIIVSSMRFNWARFIPRLTWFTPLPQQMIELPIIDVEQLGAQELDEQPINAVQPLEPQEAADNPIVISGQSGNPSPPLHPLENLPGFIV